VRKKKQINKPWFDEECLKRHKKLKQARQRWLSNNGEGKGDTNHYDNSKRNATYGLRNKKREYMTQKIQEIEENRKTNKIQGLYKELTSLRKGYQPRLEMNAEVCRRIRLKLSLCGKVISTNFLMYTTENKQRNLISIPQNCGYPSLARSRSKYR